MRRGERGGLSLGDVRQETSLGVGQLKKIVACKKEFIGISYENCHFLRRNSAVHLLLRRQHIYSTWNWFHVFSYVRLFSFCYWQGILFTPSFLFSNKYSLKQIFDRIITGSFTPGQSEPGSNSNEGDDFTFTSVPELETHQQRQFSVILRTYQSVGSQLNFKTVNEFELAYTLATLSLGT